MFHDYTSFDSADWNGWVSHLNDGELQLVSKDGGYYLDFPSSAATNGLKTLLSKTFAGLVIGSEYVISVRLSRRQEAGTGGQFVHFSVDGQSAERWEIDQNRWQRFVTKFKATQASHDIALMYEYEASNSFLGGDFQLDNLRLLDHNLHELDRASFDKDWGGWNKQSNGQGLKLIPRPDKQHCIGFDQPTNFLGPLIAKAFDDKLVSGRRYHLHMDARRAGFDVATVSVLNLLGAPSSEEQWVITSDWQTLVWSFSATENKTITLTGRNAPTLQPAGLMVDDLNIYEVYEDKTDFSGSDMSEQLNGWVLNEETTDRVAIIAEQGEGNVLNFPTYPGFTHNGVILSKRYRELAPRVKYRFEMRVRSNNNISNARLSVMNGTEHLIAETLISNQDWREFDGTFVAEGKSVLIEISNSNAASTGNDYRFSELRCFSVEA